MPVTESLYQEARLLVDAARRSALTKIRKELASRQRM